LREERIQNPSLSLVEGKSPPYALVSALSPQRAVHRVQLKQRHHHHYHHHQHNNITTTTTTTTIIIIVFVGLLC
jgi:hypothetical protein